MGAPNVKLALVKVLYIRDAVYALLSLLQRLAGVGEEITSLLGQRDERICCESVLWLTKSSLAASVKLSSSPTLTKYLSCLSSNLALKMFGAKVNYIFDT